MSASRDSLDVEADLITIEAHVDVLLDMDLHHLDRRQAEALERIGSKIARAAAALRVLLPAQPGTLRDAMRRQSEARVPRAWGGRP